MSKHTPGPWRVHDARDDDGTAFVWTERTQRPDQAFPTDTCVAIVRAFRYNEGQGGTLEEIIEADARLIAAAPTLLDACEQAEHALSMIGEYGALSHECDWLKCVGVRDALRAAIAKAEGKEATNAHHD